MFIEFFDVHFTVFGISQCSNNAFCFIIYFIKFILDILKTDLHIFRQSGNGRQNLSFHTRTLDFSELMPCTQSGYLSSLL